MECGVIQGEIIDRPPEAIETWLEEMVLSYLHCADAVSYTHLRAHETVLDLVCRLLLEKKKNKTTKIMRESFFWIRQKYPTTHIKETSN